MHVSITLFSKENAEKVARMVAVCEATRLLYQRCRSEMATRYKFFRINTALARQISSSRITHNMRILRIKNHKIHQQVPHGASSIVSSAFYFKFQMFIAHSLRVRYY